VSESAEFILGSSVSCRDGPCGELTRIGEGHLWGKRRVAIPVSAVADFSDGIRLSLARDEVRDLPAAGPAPGEE
jgi:hypothetical protein